MICYFNYFFEFGVFQILYTIYLNEFLMFVAGKLLMLIIPVAKTMPFINLIESVVFIEFIKGF